MDIMLWMSELDDHQLLAEFARAESEPAFAALVARYVNLVFSTACRFTGNPHHAEEITQAVFIILARKAGKLSPQVVLSGWLYQAARLTSANFMKSEIRRQRREQEACMQSTLNESHANAWHAIAPLLDEAMGTLGQTDRDAVVLRYFENKSAAEIGAALRMNEETARKRVNRALEKLHRYFSRRGISSTTAIIAGAISANSVHAAPVALAKTVTAVTMAKGAAISASTLTLAKGALKIMAWTNAKTAMVAGAAALLAIGTTTALVIRAERLPAPQSMPAGQNGFPRNSWVFAGFGDPHRTIMSFMWACCQPDHRIFQACLSPTQQAAYLQMIKLNLQVPQPHTAKEEMARTVARAIENWQNGSFQIIDDQTVSSTEVIIHVTAQEHGEKFTRAVKMTKIGHDWKYDGYAP